MKKPLKEIPIDIIINKMQQEKTQNFDFKTMRDLYDNGPLKDRLDCKNYIEKFFIPLTNGSHAFIEDGKVEMINNESMRNVYLNRFEDDIKKWYEKRPFQKK